MKIWTPTEKLKYSSTALLYKDTFNNVYYNRSIIRDLNCMELIYNCDFVNKIYRSSDEGRSWEEEERLTQLFKEHKFRQLEFLDKNHALIFKLEKIRVENKKYDIQQGTYYLLNNFRIVDSLKTPIGVHYNSNYNRYNFKVKNDTIFLGKWTYDESYIIGKTKYYQPLIKRVDSKWKFKVVEKLYSRSEPQRKPQLEMIAYKNFEILNNLLYLNSNMGGLIFHDNLFELHKRNLILENGNQIYIIGLNIGTLLSFDAGYNWYVYPLPLEQNSRYEFLEIDDQGVISHLKNSWERSGYEFYKVFSQFLESKE